MLWVSTPISSRCKMLPRRRLVLAAARDLAREGERALLDLDEVAVKEPQARHGGLLRVPDPGSRTAQLLGNQTALDPRAQLLDDGLRQKLGVLRRRFVAGGLNDGVELPAGAVGEYGRVGSQLHHLGIDDM